MPHAGLVSVQLLIFVLVTTFHLNVLSTGQPHVAPTSTKVTCVCGTHIGFKRFPYTAVLRPKVFFRLVERTWLPGKFARVHNRDRLTTKPGNLRWSSYLIYSQSEMGQKYALGGSFRSVRVRWKAPRQQLPLP